MDCESAKLLLYFYRPGRNPDLAAEDVAAVEAHIATCPACKAVADRNAATDRAIAPAVQAVAVPASLKAQLLASAARSIRLTWMTRAATVGAILFAGVVSVEVVNRLTRPTLDPWSAAAAFEQHLGDPQPAVMDWLRSESIPGPLAESFDLRKAVVWTDSDLNGKKVPTVWLQSGADVCRVQFVRPGAMSTATAESSQTSGATVRVYRDSPAAGWVTVVIHTGPNLNAFLRAAGPDA